MPRRKTIETQALNIRFHDLRHSYENLIEAIFQLNHSVKIRGDSYVAMLSLGQRTEIDEIIYYGTVARFTKIDLDSDWYSEDLRKVVKYEDLDNLQIPKNTHPNTKSFYIAFFPAKHKLVFEVRGQFGTISGAAVLKYFREVVRLNPIASRFGPIEVDLISDKSAIDAIFSIEVLKEITILLKVPNPDDLPAGLEEEVMKRLKEQNARSETTVLRASPGKSLKPSKQTKDLARVATRNGNAIAVGRDAGGAREERQLLDHPAKEAVRYNPETTTEEQAFRKASTEVLRKLDEV